MKPIKKYSYEDWYEKYKGQIEHSCGVHFTDGWMCSFIRKRVSIIKSEIDMLIKEHGDVEYIATNK